MNRKILTFGIIIILGVLTCVIAYSLTVIAFDTRNRASTTRSGAVHINLAQLYENMSETDKWYRRELLMRYLSQAGVKYGREALSWNEITQKECYPPNKDWSKANWDEYTKVLALYKKYGIEPVVFITATPKHCSHAPASIADDDQYNRRVKYPPIGCSSGEYDYSEGANAGYCWKWRSFINALVSKYGYGSTGLKYVKYWEIWNEPDLRNKNSGVSFAGALLAGESGETGYWWRGTAADYERLFRVAYKEIKKIDYTATVLLGGMTHLALTPGTSEYAWLSELLRIMQGMSATERVTFDIFNFHDYTGATSVLAQNARNLLAQYSRSDSPLTNKKIWVTEVSRASVDRQKLADIVLANKYSGLYSSGVELFFWFMASDMCAVHQGMDPNSALAQSGLIDCNMRPTPVYYKFMYYYKLSGYNYITKPAPNAPTTGISSPY